MIISYFIFLFLIYSLLRSFGQPAKKYKFRRDFAYEKFLEKQAGPAMIWMYFIKTRSIPESLHNIMISNAIVQDEIASYYMNFLKKQKIIGQFYA